MISRIINSLLKTEKRVTVPMLGSFMRRNDDTIVFTDMLKDDDGVLVNGVTSRMSITPIEASKDIAKFVEQVNYNLSTRGVAELSDLGLLTKTAQGKITLITKETDTKPVQQAATTTVAVQPTVTKQDTVKQENVAAKPIQTVPTIERKPKPTKVTRKSLPKRDVSNERKTDWVLIIAIVSALIALGCMAFGIFEGNVTSIILE